MKQLPIPILLILFFLPSCIRQSGPHYGTQMALYRQGYESYVQFVLPNSHARAVDGDLQAKQAKLEERLLGIADQLNNDIGRNYIAQREKLTEDDLEHSYIAWIREKHEAN